MILIRPMLAKTYTAKLYVHGSLVQPKLDGIRMLALGNDLVSRGMNKEVGETWKPNRLAHIREQLKQLRKDIIWDGELYCHGMSLQEINSRVRVTSSKIHPDENSIEYHIFDYVSRESAIQRQAYLSRLAKTWTGSKIKFVQTFPTANAKDGDTLFEQFKNAGYEGAIYRTPFMPYAIPGEHARSSDNRVAWLLKRKDALDLDAIVIGMEEGEGKLEGMLRSFLLEWNGKQFKAGSGMSDMERREYWRLGQRMAGCRVKIQYKQLTDDGYPREPVVLSVDTP